MCSGLPACLVCLLHMFIICVYQIIRVTISNFKIIESISVAIVKRVWTKLRRVSVNSYFPRDFYLNKDRTFATPKNEWIKWIARNASTFTKTECHWIDNNKWRRSWYVKRKVKQEANFVFCICVQSSYYLLYVFTFIQCVRTSINCDHTKRKKKNKIEYLQK